MSREGTRVVCLVPALAGIGGMVSFQDKLIQGLERRGVRSTRALDGGRYDAVLVVGGFRRLDLLIQARRRGIPVVQRLDGMNWIHRVPLPGGHRRTSLRHFLRAEYGNWLLRLIRARIATGIVYQSHFSQRWWERMHGPAPVASRVVYNGVDLNRYTPAGNERPPDDRWRWLVVEGSLMGGYDAGLEAGVAAALKMYQLQEGNGSARQVVLRVVGKVQAETSRVWESRLGQARGLAIEWAGAVPREQIPAIDRSAHLLYSADINAACPNSVIEAMACGLPVLAFDTGALPELVTAQAGRVVPYGGDPWKMEGADAEALARGGMEILAAGEALRRGARRQAEAFFSLDEMVDGYLQALLGGEER